MITNGTEWYSATYTSEVENLNPNSEIPTSIDAN